MLLGLPGDSTYNNYKEANKALWRLTLLPLAAKLLAALPRVGDLVPRCASGHRSRHARAGRGPAGAVDQINAANFLTDAEKREMLGLPALAKVQP
jgi:phage portal protein BeeE